MAAALKGEQDPARIGMGARPHRSEPRPRGTQQGKLEAWPPSAFSSPTPSWPVLPCPTKARFAAPTLGLAMVPRQTLGGKEDFSAQKSHPRCSTGGSAKAAPDHHGTAAARVLPWHDVISAVTSGGLSTP